MEENDGEKEIKRNDNTGVIVILFIIVLILGICVGYLFSKNYMSKKINAEENTQTIEETDYIDVKTEYKKAEYSDVDIMDKFLINNNNVIDSMFNVTHLETLRLENKSVIDDMVFADVDVYGTQFDENYLFIYDKTGKMVTYFYSMNDADNDDNEYKYNGDYEYNSNNKTLTFSTTIWFGEGEDSAGKAFNYKNIDELSKTELEKFGDFADKVKYEYKFKDGEFELVKKEEISKIKNDEYYKEYFK